MPPDEELLTAMQVCTRLHISKMTLARLRDAGRIESYKIAEKTYRYKAGEIERYLESVTTGATS